MSLLPEDDDDSTFFSPVLLQTINGACALPSGCDDPFERLAIASKYDGDTRQILDGMLDLVGQLTSMRIDVDGAKRFHADDCGLLDQAPASFRVLMILLPEG